MYFSVRSFIFTFVVVIICFVSFNVFNFHLFNVHSVELWHRLCYLCAQVEYLLSFFFGRKMSARLFCILIMPKDEWNRNAKSQIGMMYLWVHKLNASSHHICTNLMFSFICVSFFFFVFPDLLLTILIMLKADFYFAFSICFVFKWNMKYLSLSL